MEHKSLLGRGFAEHVRVAFVLEREHLDLRVACHEHGTVLSGFLPRSWDHLGCQLWDHPACLAEGSSVGSLTAHVMFFDVEVTGRGISGGQCG